MTCTSSSPASATETEPDPLFFDRVFEGFWRMTPHRALATWGCPASLLKTHIFLWWFPTSRKQNNLKLNARHWCLGLPLHCLPPIPSCKTHEAEQGGCFLNSRVANYAARAHETHAHTHTHIYTHTHAHTLHRHISLGFRTHTQSITNASKGRPLPTSSFRDVFSPSTMRDQILHLAEEKLVGNLHIGTHLSSVCRDVSTLKNQCQQLCCTSNAFSWATLWLAVR